MIVKEIVLLLTLGVSFILMLASFTTLEKSGSRLLLTAAQKRFLLTLIILLPVVGFLVTHRLKHFRHH